MPYAGADVLAQRRKDAKRYRVSKGFLCAFALCVRNIFLPTPSRDALMHLCKTARHRHCCRRVPYNCARELANFQRRS